MVVVEEYGSCMRGVFPMPKRAVLFCRERSRFYERWYNRNGMLTELVSEKEISRDEYYAAIDLAIARRLSECN